MVRGLLYSLEQTGSLKRQQTPAAAHGASLSPCLPNAISREWSVDYPIDTYLFYLYRTLLRSHRPSMVYSANELS